MNPPETLLQKNVRLAAAARYAAQLDGSYDGARRAELDAAESAAWMAIRLAHAKALGYVPGPSEAQQLGFSAL